MEGWAVARAKALEESPNSSEQPAS